MSSRIALLAGLCMAAALAAPASPALAQCRLCDSPDTSRAFHTPSGAISVEIESSLDFDRIILGRSGEGTAMLAPDGSRMVTGAVEAISGRAMVGSAVVRGEPGRFVRIELPSRIELYGLSGGSIVIDRLVSDLPAMPRLDSAGRLAFRFGGQLRIVGDAEGDYRGDIPITVEYP